MSLLFNILARVLFGYARSHAQLEHGCVFFSMSVHGRHFCRGLLDCDREAELLLPVCMYILEATYEEGPSCCVGPVCSSLYRAARGIIRSTILSDENPCVGIRCEVH